MNGFWFWSSLVFYSNPKPTGQHGTKITPRQFTSSAVDHRSGVSVMFSVWFREHLRHLHLRARCFCIAPIHPPSFWSQPRARQRVCEIRRCHLDNPFSFESRLACCFGSNQSTHEWRYRRQDFTFARSKKESRICSGSCLGQELKPKNQKTIFPKRMFGFRFKRWFFGFP